MTTRTLAPAALAAGLLAACQTSAPAPSSATVDTHEEMVRWVNPAALAVWEVTNEAMSESGGLDPTLMNEQAWTKLRAAALLLEEHSRRMASAQTLHVGAHDDEVPGFATRAEIQAMIDASPDDFRRLSREMADHAGELAAAAWTKDVRASGNLADTLSERCQACHSRYWEKPA